MGASEGSADATMGADAVVKAAKKALKREESGSMKIKHLTKSLLEKWDSSGSGSFDKNEVRRCIEESELFVVDGKVVALKKKGGGGVIGDKKRKSSAEKDNGESVKDGSATKEEADRKAAKKAAKRAKKEMKNAGKTTTESATTAAASSSGDDSSIQTWRTQHKIVLRDSRNGEEGATATKSIVSNEDYHPYQTFDAPGCREKILGELISHCTVANAFTRPTPIQAQCWPVLLSCDSKTGRHRDAVGIAETGSGKTLAFSMPALSLMSRERSLANKSGRPPRMLVLAPTRELAMQSQKVLEEFGKVVNLTSTVIYGGVPKPPQKDALRRGVDCIVCTPGRLKDLVNEGVCDLGKVRHLVLDEADRMLDMGFEEDVRYIISMCPAREARQTAMFSATWPAAIQRLAMEFMVEPVCIYVGFESIVGSNGENSIDDALSANKRVAQSVEVIEDRAREQRLSELLKKYASGKRSRDRILVFALYKKEAARLEGTLNRWGYSCASIHGDKTQDARNRALAEFKDGSCPILVATDVAARGLDIPDVEVVLNYTFPLTIEDYVHRIGRTGRAGKSGISHTFFQPGDKSHAGELQQVMRQAGQEVPDELMRFGSTIKKKEHKLYGAHSGPVGGLPMKKAVKITFDSDDE
ncbi:hypothetical protein ACHAW5_008641 [Stephanodiscus triporus]|uniref:RNA helicase n=1 Tax=Stephanodiscus triporus TaxID=2934178 RepID=A0ABD3PDB0_9STRA